jgi:hypothetical protein
LSQSPTSEGVSVFNMCVSGRHCANSATFWANIASWCEFATSICISWLSSLIEGWCVCEGGRQGKSTWVRPFCFKPSKPPCRVTKCNFGEAASSIMLLFGSLEKKLKLSYMSIGSSVRSILQHSTSCRGLRLNLFKTIRNSSRFWALRWNVTSRTKLFTNTFTQNVVEVGFFISVFRLVQTICSDPNLDHLL